MEEPRFLSEEDWRELLSETRNRQVIPIVGSGLVTTPDPASGEPIPLNRLLATQLAERLGVDPPELPADSMPRLPLNQVACQYLRKGKSRKAIYREVSDVLDKLEVDIPPALIELASITDFDLFMAGTIDPLLARALEQARPGFQRSEQVLAYDAKTPVDIPEQIGDTLVYHIVGSRQTYPYFAVWEEDYLEFLYCLAVHRGALKRLFSLLKARYLLFLGSPFNDWVVRFFLFIVKGGRFSDARRDDIGAYLADLESNLGAPLIFFFDKVVGTTRIIQGCPCKFVSEFYRRWSEEHPDGTRDEDLLRQMPDEIPRQAVFVSYSHDDRAAALELVRGLRTAGVPVWMDKQRLQAGENYNRSIQYAVKQGCSFFISLISEATESDTTRYVHEERRWAADNHVDGFVFYIPVIIDDTDLPQSEPPQFSTIHCERLPKGRVSPAFVKRLKGLVEEYRISKRPRA